MVYYSLKNNSLHNSLNKVLSLLEMIQFTWILQHSFRNADEKQVLAK